MSVVVVPETFDSIQKYCAKTGHREALALLVLVSHIPQSAFCVPHFSPVLPFCHNGINIPGMKTLTVKVPDALFAEIAGAAKARNVPKSEIVRERLARKPITSKRASLWSSMEDLVIREDVLPTDLSSNRKHLKGYGKNRPHR